MSMKRLLPFLVILVVLLALGLWKRSAQKQPSIASQADLKSLVSTDLETEDIARVELWASAKPDEKVVLAKADDNWIVQSHFDAPVDGDKLDGYLDKLVTIQGEFRAEADDEAALSDYELKDDQAFRVQGIKDGSTEPAVDLLVGKAPDRSTVFVRKAGDMTVYVESTNLRRDAGLQGDDLAEAPKPDAWTDKEILALDKEAITKVALNTPDKSMTFEKREKEVPAPEPPEGEEGEEGEETPPAVPTVETEWAMVVNGADQDFKDVALQNVLNKLKNFTASKVVDPAKKAEWGLDTPGFKAVVQAGDDEAVIEGGRPDLSGNGYVRVASNEKDVVYEVSSYNFEQLFPKGGDLVDLPSWEADKEAITSVTITQPAGQVVLAKAGENWTITQPAANLKVQQSTVDNLLNGLASWTPSDYTDNPPPAGAFDRTIEVAVGGETRSFSIAGKAKGVDGTYARIAGEDRTLIMKASDEAKLFVEPRNFFQLALLDLEPDDVTRINGRMEGEEISLRHTESGWLMEGPDGNFKVDSAKGDALLTAILELEAADVNFGGAPSEISEAGAVSIITRDGSSRLLTFGPATDGAHPLALSGMRNTFTVSVADVENLIAAFTAVQESKGEQAAAAPEAPMPAEGVDADAVPAVKHDETAGETVPAELAPAPDADAEKPEPVPAVKHDETAGETVPAELAPAPDADAEKPEPVPAPAPDTTPDAAPPEPVPAPVPAPDEAPAATEQPAEDAPAEEPAEQADKPEAAPES